MSEKLSIKNGAEDESDSEPEVKVEVNEKVAERQIAIIE